MLAGMNDEERGKFIHDTIGQITGATNELEKVIVALLTKHVQLEKRVAELEEKVAGQGIQLRDVTLQVAGLDHLVND